MKILFQARLSDTATFEVIQGNLLEEPVDAIVNAANGQLAHGGGVAAVPLDICARAYRVSAWDAGLSKLRLCLRDQPIIDAVLKELKS